MFHFRLGVSLLCLTVVASKEAYDPIPISYVTPQDIYGKGKTTDYFIAYLCGGEAFHNQTANLTLNMPTQAWDVERGDYLKAYVYGSQGGLIVTNQGNSSSKWLQDVAFVYQKTYGDLHVTVTHGGGIGQVYTMAITFNKILTETANPTRHVVTDSDMRMNHKFQMELESSGLRADAMMLVQVFRIESVGKVLSNELTYFKLYYCFLPNPKGYSIDVSVIATDESSGFGTYVCPLHIQQQTGCDLETPYADNSGAAVNFVSVPIGNADYGPVEVIVKGDGRYRLENNFFISGSRYYNATTTKGRKS